MTREDIINVTNNQATVLQESYTDFSYNLWCPLLTAYWVSGYTRWDLKDLQPLNSLQSFRGNLGL